MRHKRWYLPLAFATAPATITVGEVQTAASFDHIYALDFTGSPLADTGGGTTANLTIPGGGTLPNAAASEVGSLGSYENATDYNADNRLDAAAGVIDAARTADVFYEGLWTFPVAPGGAGGALAMVGAAAGASAHSWLNYNANLNQLELLDASGALIVADASVDDAFLTAGLCYFAVWWDHANLTFRLYSKRAGVAENAVSAAAAASSAGATDVSLFGNGTDVLSCKCLLHAFGLKRGALTATHRDLIYGATRLRF